jgi:hypothetical protein
MMRSQVVAHQAAKRWVTLGLLGLLLAEPWPAIAQLAFPGAEGFGATSVGGRGGRVFKVTNLRDKGPGSLREAVEATGPRIVVFDVSGTIELQSRLTIKYPFITIAGQTAPGGGICLKDHELVIEADHVILRFIRVRPGDNAGVELDALWVSKGRNIVIDHCSVSWGVDETLSVAASGNTLGNVTVQWCMITESLNCSLHEKGCHGYGSLVRGGWGNGITYHHNLYAHHRGRSPRPGNYNSFRIDPNGLLFDFRNNVVYNWGGSYAGYNADTDSITRMNLVGNNYVQGPNSTGDDAYREQCLYSRAFVSDNAMNGRIPADPWTLVRFDGFPQDQIKAYKQDLPIAMPAVRTDDPATAFARVLADAGATLAQRDTVDTRIVAEVVAGTGRIIDDEDEVGAWPVLASSEPLPDADRDGMPDSWELANGLDPNDPNDAVQDRTGDGFTSIEKYINGLVPPSIPSFPDADPNTNPAVKPRR